MKKLASYVLEVLYWWFILFLVFNIVTFFASADLLDSIRKTDLAEFQDRIKELVSFNLVISGCLVGAVVFILLYLGDIEEDDKDEPA